MLRIIICVVTVFVGQFIFQNCQPTKSSAPWVLGQASTTDANYAGWQIPNPTGTGNTTNTTGTIATSGTPLPSGTPSASPTPGGTPQATLYCKWEGELTKNGQPIYQVSPPDFIRQFCAQANAGGPASHSALLAACQQYAATIPLGNCNCDQWLQVCPNVK